MVAQALLLYRRSILRPDTGQVAVGCSQRSLTNFRCTSGSQADFPMYLGLQITISDVLLGERS